MSVIFPDVFTVGMVLPCPSALLGLWEGTELEPVKSEKRTAGHETEGKPLIPGSQDFSVYLGVK